MWRSRTSCSASSSDGGAIEELSADPSVHYANDAVVDFYRTILGSRLSPAISTFASDRGLLP